MEARQQPTPRSATAEAFLDAAERLLVDVGYGGITTRRLAAEAGAQQGLVHYYFGSLDEVLVPGLERFTQRRIAPQRGMYAPHPPLPLEWGPAGGFPQEGIHAG